MRQSEFTRQELKTPRVYTHHQQQHEGFEEHHLHNGCLARQIAHSRAAQAGHTCPAHMALAQGGGCHLLPTRVLHNQREEAEDGVAVHVGACVVTVCVLGVAVHVGGCVVTMCVLGWWAGVKWW